VKRREFIAGADAMANLNDEQRRALRLLARHPNGCTEAIMLAHGFTIDMLGELAAGGLLKVEVHNAHAGGRQKFVVWVQITAAGRKGERLIEFDPAAQPRSTSASIENRCSLDPEISSPDD
jgi:hypothetical protein